MSNRIEAFLVRLEKAGVTKEEALEVLDTLETIRNRDDKEVAEITTELWMSLLRKGIYRKFPTANNMIVEAMLTVTEYIIDQKVIEVLPNCSESDLDTS